MPKTADNVEEALRITMNAKGKFDLDYMQYLYRKDGQICSKEDILEELGEACISGSGKVAARRCHVRLGACRGIFKRLRKG